MELYEMVQLAVEQIDTADQNRFVDGPDANLNIIIDAIIEEVTEDHDDFNISHEGLRSRVRGILSEIDESNQNPVSSFHENFETMLGNIESDQSDITVYFPVNFMYREGSVFSLPTTTFNVTFEKVSDEEWDQYVEYTDEDSFYQNFVEDLPIRPPHTSPFSTQQFWKSTISAVDEQFAVDTVSSALSILLGKITLASNLQQLTATINSSSWNQGQALLREPLGYFTMVGGVPSGVFSDGDYDPREAYRLGPGRRSRFNDVYLDLPDFNSPNSEIETHLMTGFSAFFSAMTEPSNNQALLNYWRCLEAITFTADQNYASDEALWRAQSVAWSEPHEIADVTIERLSKKRNRLVHRGGPVSVEENDLIILKRFAEGALIFVVERKDELPLEDLNFIFEYASKTEDSLSQAKSYREGEIQNSASKIEKWEHEITLINNIINRDV